VAYQDRLISTTRNSPLHVWLAERGVAIAPPEFPVLTLRARWAASRPFVKNPSRK
jgi:hypothetical protein